MFTGWLCWFASWKTDQRGQENRKEAPTAPEPLGLRQGWKEEFGELLAKSYPQVGGWLCGERSRRTQGPGQPGVAPCQERGLISPESPAAHQSAHRQESPGQSHGPGDTRGADPSPWKTYSSSPHPSPSQNPRPWCPGAETFEPHPGSRCVTLAGQGT